MNQYSYPIVIEDNSRNFGEGVGIGKDCRLVQTNVCTE